MFFLILIKCTELLHVGKSIAKISQNGKYSFNYFRLSELETLTTCDTI